MESVEKMAEAIRRVEEIDPQECRRVVRERFSLARMLQQYLAVYRMCSGLGEAMLLYVAG